MCETALNSDWQNTPSESDFDNQAEILGSGCIRLIRAYRRIATSKYTRHQQDKTLTELCC